MLFSSFEFICIFLPIVFFGYYFLSNVSGKAVSGVFLALASLAFYAWWKPVYLPLILVSIVVNYCIGRYYILSPDSGRKRNRIPLICGVLFNLGLLGYFKYSWFIIELGANLVGSNYRIEPLLLPLAISFFTFQQIAFLVDAYKGEIRNVKFSSYSLFVAFFPQLIAGPIVHHREMMPQFEAENRKWPKWLHLEQGVKIFIIGLAKKVILADTLAGFADSGWSATESLTFWTAWGTTLCYTFQLYFDFSGYSDMALGAARLFGIHLPINFNSPYRATNIQDFWSRWHMTLSRWLRDYLYIPLGGNRLGRYLTYRNLFLTFLIGGIWHGAGWPFIIWGILHGVGTIFHRLWMRLERPLPAICGWFLTFLYVHVGWVFFRAPTVYDAKFVLSKMVNIKEIPQMIPFQELVSFFYELKWLQVGYESDELVPLQTLLYLFVASIIAFLFSNSVAISFSDKRQSSFVQGLLYASLAFACILASIQSAESPFLYFNF